MAPENRSGTDKNSSGANQSELKLPVLVFGVAEVRRLRRELEALDDFMRQGKVREPGKQPDLPKLSRLLDSLAGENKINLLQESDRRRLGMLLDNLEKTAPVMHISFASDPSSAFVAKLVAWLRANIHPLVLLKVGLQPSIAAGCVVRTTNKSFDLSLRQKLAEQRPKLISALDIVKAQAPQAESHAKEEAQR